MNAKSRYIPLDATEKAALQDINTLLPIEVYEKLATLIRQALKKLPTGDAALNDTRSHNAISIDGDRGTGKTAVLVNLKRYLSRADGLGGTTDAATDRELLSSVHVLDPIDPTLLEDGESLLLHVVVAAVLHDKELKERQRRNPERHRELNIALEHLAHGLESVESQKKSRGMDTIRALHSNQRLGECVENFFKAALHLLEKKLLVLLIDDVDTALNRAFENLDIIRRYLTTPYVLPILTGDRGLYDEVVWRDFHGRLTKDSSYLSDQAYEVARDLATEYQRKILPVQRRLTMPQVADYWKDNGVKLRGDGKDILPLQNFYAWLQIFIGGPVNGREGSEMDIPIPSVRALIQLVNHCGDLIPGLPEGVCNASSPLNAKRAWQMPNFPIVAIEKFSEIYDENILSNESLLGAYQILVDSARKNKGSSINLRSSNWVRRLEEYFQHEPRAGKAYLSLLAIEHWQEWQNRKSRDNSNGLFDTPLFQPLWHSEVGVVEFSVKYDLAEWKKKLEDFLPEAWLARVSKSRTILPYPVPEVGAVSSVSWYYKGQVDKDVKDGKLHKDDENLVLVLIDLVLQRNFYADDDRVMRLSAGRVFEVIIASLVGDVMPSDLRGILGRAPFFSTSALAPTKVIYGGVEKSSSADDDKPSTGWVNSVNGMVAPGVEIGIKKLSELINGWRANHNMKSVEVSPWLVYKVFNKVYTQLGMEAIGHDEVNTVRGLVHLVERVFYTTWSAFGSFEKGRVFGFNDVVATSNIVSLAGFESGDHYRLNIDPFFGKGYGGSVGAVSYFLKDHPICKFFESVKYISYMYDSGDPQSVDGAGA